MAIKFISSKDSDETRIRHTKSDNIETMISNETDDILILFFKDNKKN